MLSQDAARRIVGTLSKETRKPGNCTNCGAPVTLIHNSTHPTMWRDGRRYVDATVPDRGWGLFRCRRCHAVIDENWKAV